MYVDYITVIFCTHVACQASTGQCDLDIMDTFIAVSRSMLYKYPAIISVFSFLIKAAWTGNN